MGNRRYDDMMQNSDQFDDMEAYVIREVEDDDYEYVYEDEKQMDPAKLALKLQKNKIFNLVFGGIIAVISIGILTYAMIIIMGKGEFSRDGVVRNAFEAVEKHETKLLYDEMNPDVLSYYKKHQSYSEDKLKDKTREYIDELTTYIESKVGIIVDMKYDVISQSVLDDKELTKAQQELKNMDVYKVGKVYEVKTVWTVEGSHDKATFDVTITTFRSGLKWYFGGWTISMREMISEETTEN